ncbi:MAG: AprI/Inh family metalloprotease inhibitor [Caulobacteraceae bacterium]|nr:AprI/Inh family metalloprotease inhibitor [Caulobacteraceae bacterium]
MNRILPVAIAAVLSLSVGAAFAQPPASPTETPDSWQVQAKGHTVCVIRLTGRAAHGGAFRAAIPADCAGGPLPGGVTGWKPTPGGMALVGEDGSTLVNLDRWSESLFVSSGPGAPDLQLARALPNSER